VQCSTYRESGSCSNSRMVNRNKIEAAALDGLREVLKDPGYWKHYLQVYNEERRLLANGAVRDRAKLERRAGEIKRETDRLVDAIAQGSPADVIAPKLKALHAEGLSVQEQLAVADIKGKPVTIHPAAIRNYLADVETMRSALDDTEAAERPELIAPLRRLIHTVVVHAQPGVKGAFDVEIKGRLQELLGAPFLRRSMGGGPLVAGEGLEPPTPGL
jgi:site-specific DNA recombinase